MSLSILTIDIVDGQTGVHPTKVFNITFDSAIDSDSINESTVYLYDNTIDAQVPLKYYVSSSALRITPTYVLQSLKTFTLTLTGKYTSGQAEDSYIESSTGDYFENTTSFTFTTAEPSDVVVISTPPGISDLPGIYNSTLYSSIPGDLDIESVSPSPLYAGISTSLSQIVIRFSEDISDQSDLVDIDIQPILNSNDYLVQEDSGTYVYYYNDRGTSYTWGMPDYSLLWTGEYLYITFSSDDGLVSASNPWLYGSSVKVELDSTIAGTSGATLGEDVNYEFILEALPVFATVEMVKFHPVFILLGDASDALIYKLLTYYSNDLRRRYTELNPDYTYLAARDFVVCSVLKHLLSKLLVASNLHGRVSSKTLGDFSIDYSIDNEQRLAMDGPSALFSLQDCINSAIYAMTGSMAVGTRGRTSGYYHYVFTRIPRSDDYYRGAVTTTKGRYADTSNLSSWPYQSQGDLL